MYEEVEDIVGAEDAKDNLVESEVDEEDDDVNPEVGETVVLRSAILVALTKPANVDEEDMRVEL